MKSLKEMPRDKAIKIVEAWLDGSPLEYYDSLIDTWVKSLDPVLAKFSVYRVERTYPQPPWDVIDEEWQWFAIDNDGARYFYEKEPARFADEWGPSTPESMPDCEGSTLLVFPLGNCDWTNSKVKRP